MNEQEAIKQFQRQLDYVEAHNAMVKANCMGYLQDGSKELLAIKALEKQVAKKPTTLTKYNYCCPNCGLHVDPKISYCSYVANSKKGCGQRLDWVIVKDDWSG